MRYHLDSDCATKSFDGTSDSRKLSYTWAQRGRLPGLSLTYLTSVSSSDNHRSSTQLVPAKMKLSASLGLLSDLRAALGVATLPTLKAIYREPSLVIRPSALSRTFMAAVWAAFAAPTDEGARPTKLTLIPPHAKGAVLDIGAGRRSVRTHATLPTNILQATDIASTTLTAAR